MKTLLALSALAALVAFVLVPISFEIAVSLLFAAGLTVIVAGDYGHVVRPLRLRSAPVAAQRSERFRLAA
jgi:hypothetical protein